MIQVRKTKNPPKN